MAWSGAHQIDPPEMGVGGARRDAASPREIDFARQKRRMGASWDAIGAMLGRRGADLRALCEMSAPPSPAAVAVAVTPSAPPPPVEPAAPRRAGRPEGLNSVMPGSVQARVLELLGEGAKTMGEVGDRFGRTSNWACAVLWPLATKTLVRRRETKPIIWVITPAGRRELERLERLAQSLSTGRRR